MILVKNYKRQKAKQQDFTCQGISADHPPNTEEELNYKLENAQIKLKGLVIFDSDVRARPGTASNRGWSGCPVIRGSSHLPLYLTPLVYFIMIYICLQRVFSLVLPINFMVFISLSVSEKNKVNDNKSGLYFS